jgi:hypothetical protein
VFGAMSSSISLKTIFDGACVRPAAKARHLISHGGSTGQSRLTRLLVACPLRARLGSYKESVGLLHPHLGPRRTDTMTTTYGFGLTLLAPPAHVTPALPGSTRLRLCSTARLLSPAPPCALASCADSALSRRRRPHHHGVVTLHRARGISARRAEPPHRAHARQRSAWTMIHLLSVTLRVSPDLQEMLQACSCNKLNLPRSVFNS